MRRIAAALSIFFFGLVGIAGSAWADDPASLGFKKPLEDEARTPDRTPAAEAFLLRAYPATDIPSDASWAARSDWAALNASAHSTGSWQLIGPSKATYPSVLNPFLFDGAQYVASGRVTAMAIARPARRASARFTPRQQGAASGVPTRRSTVRIGSTSPATSARTRSVRCSWIRVMLRVTRSMPARASRTPRPIRKRASASTRRRTAARRGRSCPAATSSSSARSDRWLSTTTVTCLFRSPAAFAASARFRVAPLRAARQVIRW